jgi:hypothetical protein
MKLRHAGPTADNRHGRPDVITKQTFDRKVMYVGRRIRVASIKTKALGTSIPRLKETGYLLVHGDKPGLLIHEVKWDGKDVYQRANMNKFGSLAALNSTKHPGYRAEIIDRQELIKRLAKHPRIVECKLMDDDSEHVIALLNKNGDPYVAGIEIVNGKIVPRNLEPPRPCNKDAKGVRFVDFRDVKMSLTRFLTGKAH